MRLQSTLTVVFLSVNACDIQYDLFSSACKANGMTKLVTKGAMSSHMDYIIETTLHASTIYQIRKGTSVQNIVELK